MTHPPRYRAGGLFCSGCARPLPETRRGTYCSDVCEHESKVRSSPSYTRGKVFERDGGVCDLCEMDTVAMVTRLNGIVEADPELYQAECEALGIPDHRRSLWDMDHIVPVVEGGGQCSLEGYRTLCLWCHSEITADLNSKLARDRQPRLDPPPEVPVTPPEILVIHLLRKPASEVTVAENVLRWGCGGLNIDATRIESTGEHIKGFLPSNTSRTVLGQHRGFQATDHPGGRWPSNVILEHLPECRIVGEETIPNWVCVEDCACRDLDGQSGVLRAAGNIKPSKRTSALSWFAPGKGWRLSPFNDSGGASRFFKQIQGE